MKETNDRTIKFDNSTLKSEWYNESCNTLLWCYVVNTVDLWHLNLTLDEVYVNVCTFESVVIYLRVVFVRNIKETILEINNWRSYVNSKFVSVHRNNLSFFIFFLSFMSSTKRIHKIVSWRKKSLLLCTVLYFLWYSNLISLFCVFSFF